MNASGADAFLIRASGMIHPCNGDEFHGNLRTVVADSDGGVELELGNTAQFRSSPLGTQDGACSCSQLCYNHLDSVGDGGG